jgi:hypothetical protein
MIVAFPRRGAPGTSASDCWPFVPAALRRRTKSPAGDLPPSPCVPSSRARPQFRPTSQGSSPSPLPVATAEHRSTPAIAWVARGQEVGNAFALRVVSEAPRTDDRSVPTTVLSGTRNREVPVPEIRKRRDANLFERERQAQRGRSHGRAMQCFHLLINCTTKPWHVNANFGRRPNDSPSSRKRAWA